ncbi:2-oxoadipate dioxygenase/decarboxylase family protein [Spirosoma fluminis]
MTTSSTKIQTVEAVLNGLMRRYSERVPDVQNVIDSMIDEGIVQSADEIENDHIAFRTMGVPNLGLASFEKIFMHYGYERRDEYNFTGKKLTAYWYAPPKPSFPRIFASELRVQELSDEAQQIIHRYTDTVTSDPVDALDLDDAEAVDHFLHQPLWTTPTLSDYKTLLAESEYAAWVIYNRYYLNHFTISVHNLRSGYNTIDEFVAFLQARGFKLNSAGGTIKVSPDGDLRQASTVAQLIDADFADGDTFRIAGSYVEFAERRVLPQFNHLPAEEITRAHRREGFETGNADKIFESTFTTQTDR